MKRNTVSQRAPFQPPDYSRDYNVYLPLNISSLLLLRVDPLIV